MKRHACALRSRRGTGIEPQFDLIRSRSLARLASRGYVYVAPPSHLHWCARALASRFGVKAFCWTMPVGFRHAPDQIEPAL